jgi:hypothetical protein
MPKRNFGPRMPPDRGLEMPSRWHGAPIAKLQPRRPMPKPKRARGSIHALPDTVYEEILDILKKTSMRRWRRMDDKLTPKRTIDAAAIKIRQTMLKAVRYQFDDDACTAACIFSIRHMDALLAGIRWLRPLGDHVWIEYDQHVALKALDPEYAQYPEDIPQRAGFLISANEETMVIQLIAVRGGLVYLPLVKAAFEPTGQLGAGITKILTDREIYKPEAGDQTTRWLIGFLPKPDTPALLRMVAQQLSDHFLIIPMMSILDNEEMSQRITAELNVHAGFARRAVSFLFMLTHRKLVAARLRDDQGQRPVWSHDLPYWGDSVIGIRLPREKAVGSLVRFAQRTNRPPCRRHGVEPHWCWSHKTDLGCAHDWQEENDGRRFRCARCSGLRWWKKKYERGDASRGWVIQRRVVTTKAH